VQTAGGASRRRKIELPNNPPPRLQRASYHVGRKRECKLTCLGALLEIERIQTDLFRLYPFFTVGYHARKDLVCLQQKRRFSNQKPLLVRRSGCVLGPLCRNGTPRWPPSVRLAKKIAHSRTFPHSGKAFLPKQLRVLSLATIATSLLCTCRSRINFINLSLAARPTFCAIISGPRLDLELQCPPFSALRHVERSKRLRVEWGQD